MHSKRISSLLVTLSLAGPLPALAGLYDAPVDAASLTAAYEGWRKLYQEMHLVGPFYGVIQSPSISSQDPSHGIVIGYPDFGGIVIGTSFTIRTAFSDADFGELGATVYLGSEYLKLGASFDTFRDVVIGYSTRDSGLAIVFLPDDEPGLTPVAPAPVLPSPAGPAWIDTQGHDFGIHGRITAYRTLYKQGDGTLRLTHAENVWNAAPVVYQGVLAASAAGLRTDVSLASNGMVRFEQSAADRFDHVVSGNGTLVKAGQGELLLSRAQALTGALHVIEGRLALAAEATPGERVRILVKDGATFDLAARTDVTEVAALSGSGNVVLGNGALLIGSAAQAGESFAGRLSGVGALEVGSGARIELSGHNTQAGGVLVRGVLVTGSDSSLGARGKALSLDDGQLILSASFELDRTLRSTGNSALDQGEHRLILNQGLSGSGSLSKTGSGTLVLTDAGDFFGTLNVQAGALALAGGGSSGAGSRVALARETLFDIAGADGPRVIAGLSNDTGGATVRLGNNALRVHQSASTAFHGRIEGSGAFEKGGSGSLYVGDAAWTGTTRILAGELSVHPGLGSLRVENDGVLRMTVHDTASAWSGKLSGSGNFVKSGSGLLWLRGDNTQAKVLIMEGVLAGRSGTLGRDIEVGSGAGVAFFIDEDDRHEGMISGTGTLYSYGNGALTLAGTYLHSGGTAIANTLRIDNDDRLGAPGAGLLIAGGTLQALGDLDLRRHIALGADGGTLDSNGFNITLRGRVDGPGGLTKAGAGRLTLLGNRDYAGHTLVAGGELVFAGALEGSFEVLAGARLVGSGFLDGDIAVHDGGSLWLTGEALEVSGDIRLGGTLNIDLARHISNDPVLTAGRLTIAHAVELDLSGLDLAATPRRLVLARANDIVFADGGRLALSDDLIQAGYRFEVSEGSLALLAAPVPEPSITALLLAGLGLLGWRTGLMRKLRT